MTQSTGHEKQPHVSLSTTCLHALPPMRGCAVMERVRVRAPHVNAMLHELLQAENVDHCVYVQSAGQACALHVRVSWRCAHFFPPKAGCTLIARTRFAFPAPHDLLQALHCPH